MGLFDKVSSAKFGDSKILVTPEGFTEGSISWKQISIAAIDDMADGWFEEYRPAPITQCIPKGALDADQNVRAYAADFASSLTGENEPKGIPGLEIDLDALGEQIDITAGELGPAIIAALDNAGVTWRFETILPISQATSVEPPEDKTIGVSQWKTYFGLPFDQTFRVYKNASGKEICLWSSKVLAATRPFEHITIRELRDTSADETLIAEIEPESIAKGALTFGEWSTKVYLPTFAKGLFYLAETPFPSTVLMSFSRGVAFGEDLAPENYPRPVLINSTQAYARSVYDETDEGYLATTTIMPHVVEMGWTFSTTNDDEILDILGVITAGLARINTILDDGYLNYRTDEYSYPYDDVLLSATKFDAAYIQGGDARGMSYWVPVVRLGLLLNETNVRAAAAINQDNVDEQIWVANNGAGMLVPAAINSLVFSTLIPAKEWHTIDRLLDISVRLDVLNESTNSLGNWGIAKFKQGLVDEAIEKFELALARPDQYSEDEASYWLAEIWQQKGDVAKAETFRARCQAAGGYEPGAGFGPNDTWSAPPPQTGGGLTKSSVGGLGGGLSSPPLPKPAAGLASFCGQCGTKFEASSAKFCGTCGSPRQS